MKLTNLITLTFAFAMSASNQPTDRYMTTGKNY